MTKSDVTVYIGRFNPFHIGHAYVLKRALQKSKLTIVIVGSAGQARSIKNPFTAGERMAMIEAYASTVDGAGSLRMIAVEDSPYNHNEWIQTVQSKVKDIIRSEAIAKSELLLDTYLTGSDRDDSTWYLNAFPQWKKDFVDVHQLDAPGQSDHGDLSATSVREVLYTSNMASKDIEKLKYKVPVSTLMFLEEFASTDALTVLREEYRFNKKYKDAWASAPYAPTFSTADAVVIQSGHVLVVKRGALPGKGLYALPGGFVKPRQTIKEAAIEEVIEETGIRLAEGKRALEITRSMLNGAIRGKEIFDDPDRSARGRTITVAYLFRLDDTKPLPKVKGQFMPLEETGGVEIVETADAFWLSLDQALSPRSSHLWFEDHRAILKTMAALKE